MARAVAIARCLALRVDDAAKLMGQSCCMHHTRHVLQQRRQGPTTCHSNTSVQQTTGDKGDDDPLKQYTLAVALHTLKKTDAATRQGTKDSNIFAGLQIHY